MVSQACENPNGTARPDPPAAAFHTSPRTGSVLALAGAVFAAAASTRCLDVALPVVASDFGCTLGSAGAAVSAYAVGFGVFQLVHGPLGDRVGAYRVVTAAAFLSALLAGACGLAPSLPALAALRFGAGSIAAAIGPLSLAWLSGSYSPADRSLTLARMTGVAILGTAAGQAGGGIISGAIGWPSLFAVLALLFAASAAALTWFGEWRPGGTMRSRPGAWAGGRAANPLLLVKRPSVARVLVAVSIEGAAIYLSLSYAGGILHERLGVGPTRAGLLCAAYGLGGVAVVALAYPLLRRTRASARAACGAATLGVGLLALGFCSTQVGATAALFASGIGFLLLHNVLQVLAAEMAPDAVGSALSLFAASTVLSQALGAAAGGYLFDHLGARVVCSISAVGVFALGFLLSTARSGAFFKAPGASAT